MLTRILAFVLSFSLLSRGLFFNEEFTNIYIAVLIFSAFVIAISAFYTKPTISIYMVIFLAISMFSIILNEINSYFSPWERLMAFFVLVFVLGPFGNTNFLLRFKNQLVRYSRLLLFLITIISFIFFLFGFYIIEGKGFSGITTHSMMLAPYASISALYALDSYNTLNKQKKSLRILYLTILSLSIVVVIITASRGAIGALLISIIFYFYVKNRNRIGNFFKYTAFISSIILLFMTINPGSIFDTLFGKLQRTEGYSSGRDIMLSDRIKDFKYSPVIGVGFATMKETSNSAINKDINSIEPGSGWLFLLSSIGLLGTLFFVLLIIPPIYIIIKKYPEFIVYASIAVFFIIHLTIEGYPLAVGSPLFGLLWLNMGILNIFTRQKSANYWKRFDSGLYFKPKLNQLQIL
jgi:O-antigen ligase